MPSKKKPAAKPSKKKPAAKKLTSAKGRQARKGRRRTAAQRAQPAQPLPPFRGNAATVDRIAEFLEISTTPAPSPEVVRAFESAKLKLLRTHPTIHPLARAAVAESFRANAAPAALFAEEEGPIPGGVGYGMFYNSAFKGGYATGTAISWEIICPTLPGGNVNTWLYITATNRSAKGVEAFVSYQGQTQFTFSIFDWARPEAERWRPSTPFANLGKYLGNETVQGIPCQVLAVINTTVERSPGFWANEVSLLDVLANEWHLVYQHEYEATLQQQQGDWVGSWGPIVETFQDAYSGTSLMGALKTQILSRDSNGNWGQWGHLTASQSDLRVDNKGFMSVFLEKNFSWGVNS